LAIPNQTNARRLLWHAALLIHPDHWKYELMEIYPR
jgi:hypothetical protein